MGNNDFSYNPNFRSNRSGFTVELSFNSLERRSQMSDTMTAFNSEAEYTGSQIKKKRGTTGRIFHELLSNKFMYALALPGMIWFFVFAYLPMGGIVIAFQDFKVMKGIKGASSSD